uniref:Thaumatin-like protein n=1 Tax=Aegilops tauschii TaxID=37682 RepID=M8BI92_AEGTA
MGIQRVWVVLALLCMCLREGGAVTFTFLNRCTGTVWPGILSNAGTARIEPTGFALPPGAARALPFPTGWSGRMWARTGCAQDAAGRGCLACRGRFDPCGFHFYCRRFAHQRQTSEQGRAAIFSSCGEVRID